MRVAAELCLIPSVAGVSVSAYIAECQRVLDAAGLHHELHAWGTNIEGDWEAVLAAVKQCHERVHAMGAVRITSMLKIGTRTDREQTLADKVASVNERL